MNTKQLKELAEMMRLNGLTHFELTEGDVHIHMERAEVLVAASVAPSTQQPMPAPIDDAQDPSMDFNDLQKVTSPLVGVFYTAPSPDAEPFVKIGSKVKKGDILCIVEAMKLMNEITADQDGEIVDVCVKNGDVVEFGQVLFKVHG